MSDEHRMGNQPPFDVPPEHPEHWIDKLRRASGYTDAECIADLRKMLKTERDEVDRLRAENADYANRLDDWRLQAGEALRRVAKLEAENAALREQNSVAISRIGAYDFELSQARAKLAAIQEACEEHTTVNGILTAIRDWEKRNPGPVKS